ncbi:MAG: hypothetical protein F4Y27_14925 [Acidimicrobiaceae bacterium]|nr:hypothetical protein [Acidimicrobiaceae bacterium]MYG56244.1 hypothetical protein [Acidimicrobiaceae bacterium]MYJ98277.1 hypothetical protein [Acidimicrobiaceae bacterium]
MDPRHVLSVLALLLAVGCASGEDAAPSTTTSVVEPSRTLAAETSQTGSGSVEQPERDSGAPDTVESVTTVELDPVEPVTTTTLVAEVPEVVEPPPSSVEEAEPDSGSSVSDDVQVTDRPESAAAVLRSRLEALAVQPERRSGYHRDLFDHWVDADGDRCDARREVLIAEAVIAPRVGTSCSLSGGE